MRLACPVEGTWTVPVAPAVEHWQRTDGGETAELIGGRCESCGSQVLIEPSDDAVAIATARVAAMRAAMAKAAAA